MTIDTILIRTRIERPGELHLSNLPFQADEEVEVTLRPARDNGVESDFWRCPSLVELYSSQNMHGAEVDAMMGGWPEGETVDDFLAAREQWRREDMEGQK